MSRYTLSLCRKLLLWSMVSFSGLLTLTSDAQTSTNRPPAPRRPNIILILADDLGYGDLGCYGQTQIKTPNIDKLAEDGMKFTSFYAGSTVCAPSRATLMTGKNTGHVNIRGNADLSLNGEELTIAKILKLAGYATGCIGKWGLGNEGSPGLPGRQGFDEYLGYLDQVQAHDYYPTHLFRSDSKGEESKIALTENDADHKGLYSNDFFTQSALNYLRINKPSKLNKHRSFFLYLPYTLPHANNELGNRTGNGMEVPSTEPYTNEQWPQVEKNKAAMITRLDHYVGEIMDYLKKSKLDENTVVIFASDNGPHKEGGVNPKYFNSAGGLRGIKRDLYEGGIRVPFIVRWPARVKAGSISDAPLAFWDFLPTAAEIARTSSPTNIDGISFLPTLLGKAQTNRHQYLYWEFHEQGFDQAVRMGDWKAVRHGINGPIELYNLKTDVSEKDNVADKNPEVMAKIADYLKKARTDDPRWPAKTVAEIKEDQETKVK
ncbi:arylsulfatase [Pedosphaera parvula]|uniref:Sulfatase n=1 Tax=Pedosphaera parvula (strain Ellin514) TaxID=320771 RepID=B9XF83_PEDPL|nr:arylsulfatase [Pedosphaera parvula]EEF61581.1 sulfatase [Pedosphaera parvula Ellin514]